MQYTGTIRPSARSPKESFIHLLRTSNGQFAFLDPLPLHYLSPFVDFVTQQRTQCSPTSMHLAR